MEEFEPWSLERSCAKECKNFCVTMGARTKVIMSTVNLIMIGWPNGCIADCYGEWPIIMRLTVTMHL